VNLAVESAMRRSDSGVVIVLVFAKPYCKSVQLSPELVGCQMGVRTLNCELCGAEFECMGLLKCWCSKVRVPKKRLQAVSERALDCVCPRCLRGQELLRQK
jgi:hypothetical protein